LAETEAFEDVSETIRDLNAEFKSLNMKKSDGKYAVLQLGSPAPGSNNIIDGLL